MEITLRSLLDLVIEKDASDLHLGVGVAPMMRIDGVLGAVRDTTPMTFEEVERSLLEVISPEQYKKFMETHELDFSFSSYRPGATVRQCVCGHSSVHLAAYAFSNRHHAQPIRG